VSASEVKDSARARRRRLLGAFVCIALVVVAFVWIARKPKDGSGPPETQPVPTGNLQVPADSPEAVAQPAVPGNEIVAAGGPHDDSDQQSPAKKLPVPEPTKPDLAAELRKALEAAEAAEAARAAKAPVPIETGFFFRRGDYVSPPYRVTTDEDGVKINGICVVKRPRQPEWTHLPKKDPGEFKWTPALRKKGLIGSGFKEHAFSCFKYWCGKYDFEEACRRLTEYIAGQNPGEKVTVMGDGSKGRLTLAYEDRDGALHHWSFERAQETDPRLRAALERAYVEREAESVRRKLSLGGVLIVDRSFISMSTEKLPRICRIAASALSEDEKVTALVQQQLLSGEDNARAFVKGFEERATLSKRLKQILKE